MKEDDFKLSIASRLKILRIENSLSLDATAKLTSVSKAMLGQIERQESSPTVATLWKIATGLNVSLSSFFVSTSQQPEVNKLFNDEFMTVKTLFPYSNDSRMEVFEISLTDQYQRISEPHKKGVIEHIIVISGTLEVLFNGDWHCLNEGDSIKFKADQKHGYKAKSSQAKFQNIIVYCE